MELSNIYLESIDDVSMYIIPDNICSLIEQGIDVNIHDASYEYPSSPLYEVVVNTKNVNDIHILLSHGANPNVVYDRPTKRVNLLFYVIMHYPICKKYMSVCKLLVEYGADVHSKYNELSLLYYAIAARRVDAIEYLQSLGLELSQKDKEELISYVHNIYPSIWVKDLEFYIKYNLDLDISGYYGETLLRRACMDDRPDGVSLFLKYGANPYIVPDGRRSILHLASKYSYRSLEILLKYGMNPNIKDTTGDSLLLDIVKARYIKAINILLKYGADPYMEDNKGQSVLNYVIDQNDEEILSIFEKYL